jgi:AsmA protein
MRIRRIWPALGAGLLVLALALIPWSLLGSRMTRHAIAQIHGVTGLESEIGAPATFSLLPRPNIAFENVVIHDAEGALRIESPKATGNLRLLSLIAGKIELASVTLRRPTIFINTDGRPLHQAGLIAAAVAGQANADADAAHIGSLSIESGLAFARSRASGFETLIEDINGTLSWPALGASASLAGLATWRGMAGRISATLERPAMLLRGDTSNTQLSFASSSGSLSFDGRIVSGANPQLSGKFMASAPSLDRLLRVFHLEIPLSGAVQAIALSGDLRASAREFSLTGANLKADANNFEGNLALNRSEGRLHLAGTLATELLSLDSILSGLSDLAAKVSQTSEPPPDLDRLAARLARELAHGEIDLRVSAANVRWQHLNFTDAAMSVLSSGSDIELSLAEAHGYNGMVKGKARIGSGARGFDIRASGGFIKTDLALLFGDLLGMPRVSGTGSGLFNLETSGASLGQLRENLGGHGQIGVRAGELDGIDLGLTLLRAEREPLAFEHSAGRTPFDLASANFNVANGVLTVSDGVFSGPTIAMSLAGAISMTDGSGSLKASTTQSANAAIKRPLSFDISGPWRNPSVKLDRQKIAHPKTGLDATSSGTLSAEEE